MRKPALLGLALSVVLAAPALGATWGVSATTDTPPGQQCAGFTGCSLREAVTSTELNPGPDAILVNGGGITYPLSNGQLTVTQDLTVSRVGAGAATISGANASRIFNVTGSGTDFVLRFMTLTNGLAPGDGGAILAGVGTTLSIESSTISNSTASLAAGASGGAISAGGSVSIVTASGSTTGSSITGNTVSASDVGSVARGGGVAADGTLTIGSRTTISGNQATDAGTGSDARGGGIFSTAPTSLNGAKVSGNQVTGGSGIGGGIAAMSGALTLTRTTVNGNTATTTGDGATGGGGGIGLPSSGTATAALDLSTVSDNTAAVTAGGGGSLARGGGIGEFVSVGTVTLTNSTVAGNTATATSLNTASGGGVHATSATVTVGGTILAENTQTSSSSQCSGATLLSNGYAVLGDISGCTYSAGTGDVTGVTDAGITPLGDFGGLINTRMLELGSAALDIIPAANALCTTQSTDQRGTARPQNINCDAGSVEARPATLTITPDPRSFATTTQSGSSSADVTISNAGELAMSAAPSPSMSSPFSYTSGCTAAVAAGSSCIMTLGMASATAGDFSKTLTVVSGSLSDTATLTGSIFGNTVAPVVTGGTSPLVGEGLTVDNGTWAGGTPSTYARSWQLCDADGSSNCGAIGGATTTSYTPLESDVGHTLRVRTVANNGTLDSDPVLTSATGMVGFANTVLPALTGGSAPHPGDTLSVGDGTWTATPDGYTRAWQHCDADGVSNCAAIAGANGTSYTATSDDLGHRLRVSVVATKSGFSTSPVFTTASAVVAAAPSGDTGGNGGSGGNGGDGGNGGNGGDGAIGGPSAFFQCDRDVLVLYDVRRAAGRVLVRGFAPQHFAGQQLAISASRGGAGSTATVQPDGTFEGTLAPPRGHNAGATNYTAVLGALKSGSLRLDRRFVLLSTRTTSAGIVVRARVVGGRPGLKVSIRRQLPCIGSLTFTTARLGAGGTLTVTLPRPADAGDIVLYRAIAALPRFPVWTLPIVARAD